MNDARPPDAEEHGDEADPTAEPPVVESTSVPATAHEPAGDDEAKPTPPWWRRPRLSTVILTVVFVGAFVLWLWVRPETPPQPYQVPVVPAAVTTSTTAPAPRRTTPSTTSPPTTTSPAPSTSPATATSSTVAQPSSSSTTSAPSASSTTQSPGTTTTSAPALP